MLVIPTKIIPSVKFMDNDNNHEPKPNHKLTNHYIQQTADRKCHKINLLARKSKYRVIIYSNMVCACYV